MQLNDLIRLNELLYVDEIKDVAKALKYCNIIQILTKQEPSLIQLLHHSFNTYNCDKTTQQYQMQLSHTIMRFINIYCDAQQQGISGKEKLPLHFIAQHINIPHYIIEVRNQISHEQAPPLYILEEVCQFIQQYLEKQLKQEIQKLQQIHDDIEIEQYFSNKQCNEILNYFSSFIYQIFQQFSDNQQPEHQILLSIQHIMQLLYKYHTDFTQQEYEYLCAGMHFTLLNYIQVLSNDLQLFKLFMLNILNSKNNQTNEFLVMQEDISIYTIVTKIIQVVSETAPVSNLFLKIINKPLLSLKQNIQKQKICELGKSKLLIVNDKHAQFYMDGQTRYGCDLNMLMKFKLQILQKQQNKLQPNTIIVKTNFPELHECNRIVEKEEILQILWQ